MTEKNTDPTVRVYTCSKPGSILGVTILSGMFLFFCGLWLLIRQEFHSYGFSARNLVSLAALFMLWSFFGFCAVSLLLSIINCRIEVRPTELYFRDWRTRESHVPWDEIRSIRRIDVNGRYEVSPYRLDIESESATGGRYQSRIDIGFLDASALRQLLEDKAGARQVGEPTRTLLSFKIITHYLCADRDRQTPGATIDS